MSNHLTPLRMLRARFKTRRVFHQTSNVLYLLENSWKTGELCLIITFKKKRRSIWCCDFAEDVKISHLLLIIRIHIYNNMNCLFIYSTAPPAFSTLLQPNTLETRFSDRTFDTFFTFTISTHFCFHL